MAGIQELGDFAVMTSTHDRTAAEDWLLLALAEYALGWTRPTPPGRPPTT